MFGDHALVCPSKRDGTVRYIVKSDILHVGGRRLSDLEAENKAGQPESQRMDLGKIVASSGQWAFGGS